MIQVSEEYKKACEDSTRKSYVIAKYGIFNKLAKGQISKVESEKKAFSNINKTYNEIKDTKYNYISCEPNRVLLDDNFYFLANKEVANEKELIAYWSNELSNANGLFTTNPKITYEFTQNIAFTELTLYFQEICVEFDVRYYLDGTLVALREVRNNTSLIPTTEGAITLSDIYFNKIEIEFIKTNEPYRYIKFNEIDFGVYELFTNEQIIDYNILEELSIDSSELSSNSFNLIIDDEQGQYDILNPDNKLNKLQERQEISFYHYLQVGNEFKEMPLGTFLLKKFDVKDMRLEIEAYDDTYFMNKVYYGSKFYKDVEVKQILQDLFEYFNYVNYKIDDELNGIKLTGYIPNVEFREALRLICEASCAVINKTRFGETYIFKTYDNVAKNFTRNIIFKENPNRNLFNNVVDVVEYNFGSKTESAEIYNATLPIGKHTVLFTKFPVDEATIIKGTVNYDYTILEKYSTSCVIDVRVETNVVLKGTLYNTTSIVKRIVKDENVVFDDYAISKVDNKLITSLNSVGVGQWKLSRNDIKYNFETLQLPYIEVGDTCTYSTKYNTNNVFIPTRIEFSKSIRQNIEGE